MFTYVDPLYHYISVSDHTNAKLGRSGRISYLHSSYNLSLTSLYANFVNLFQNCSFLQTLNLTPFDLTYNSTSCRPLVVRVSGYAGWSTTYTNTEDVFYVGASLKLTIVMFQLFAARSFHITYSSKMAAIIELSHGLGLSESSRWLH